MSQPARDPNIDAALDWLLRLQASPADEDLRAAAEAWRREDPERARAWKRAERAWHYAAGEGAGPEQEQAAFIPPAVPVRPSWARARLAIPLAGLVVAVAIGGASLVGRSDYATATAELRPIALDDGTRIELSAETSIDVAFTADRRSVTLLKGEAFFEVAPDAGRPFVVTAANLSIEVVGTAFNVRLSPGSTTVAVSEGIVETRFSGRTSVPTRLTKGDVVEIGRDSGSIRRTRILPDEVAPWRDHRMIVHGVPLREAVADLRRYSNAWIVFDDSHLAEQQVTGVYDLREPDRALRLLTGPFGATVREITPFIRVISGP